MQRRMPPLNAIRAFEAVARHEHLGRAAEELGVTHSAVSQQLKHLEEWFGIEVFSREKAGLVLKPEGHELLAGYSQALDLLQNTSDKLMGDEGPQELMLYCDPSFFKNVLMKCRAAINAAAPNTTFNIVSSRKPGDSFPDDADIVVDLSRHRSWRNVHWEHLIDLHEFPACSPELLTEYPKPKRPLDVKNLPLLHGFNRDSWNSWLVEYAGTTSAGCNNTFFDDFNLTIDAAMQGTGAIMADPILCRDALERGTLMPLFEGTVNQVSYFAFCSSPKYGTRTVRRVFDALVREIRTYGGKISDEFAEQPKPVRSWDPSGSSHRSKS